MRWRICLQQRRVASSKSRARGGRELWRSACSQISQRKKRDGNFFAPFRAGLETKPKWERDYKWNAHLRWQEALSESAFRRLLDQRQFAEIARIATNIKSRTNLLFSFEKMALRDAIRSPAGARLLPPHCSISCMELSRSISSFSVGSQW